jgi:hypothetical protein
MRHELASKVWRPSRFIVNSEVSNVGVDERVPRGQ